MGNRSQVLGIKSKTVRIIHKIMLAAILHSSFIAPSQVMITDYFNLIKPLKYKGSQSLTTEREASVNENDQSETIIPNGVARQFHLPNLGPAVKSNYSILPDVKQGIIGTGTQNPIDDARDNLFKFSIAELPAQMAHIYLAYDLYGVQDKNAVSRSINDRFATGGYLVKLQHDWTSQKEELDVNWLRTGENKILFSIPEGANYQYQIKNVRLEVIYDANPFTALSFDLPEQQSIKDDKIYLKGFLRNNPANAKVFIDDEPLIYKDGEFEGFFTITETVKLKKFALLKALDSNGLLGQEIIPLGQFEQADRIFEIDEKTDRKASIFTSNVGGKLNIEGAGITVTDSALVVSTELQITKLRKIDLAPMASGMLNVTKNGLGYRFLPDGLKFRKPVSIAIDYDEKLIPPGYTPNDIKTYYFNTNSKSWVAIERDSLDRDAKTVISLTNHFTDYVNGIIQTPESPETAAFTPTMMSDIKAADPSAEMTIIAPPAASQKGDANINYPIKIPAGRRGMQPDLSINYSNQGENGWLAQGWSLDIPSVSIDTRWGVPTLSNEFETEIYLLNGQQMMYPNYNTKNWMPNRHYDAGPNTTLYSTLARPRIATEEAKFTMRRQDSYTVIERLGTNHNNFYWKATTADGTIYWYGGKTQIENNSVIRNSSGDVVHWGLYMVEDVYGNNMKYFYKNQIVTGLSGDNFNLNNGKVFHVNRIAYTGYMDAEEGGYEVLFADEGDQTNTPVVRLDATTDARLGVKMTEPYTLAEIVVKQTGTSEIIRKYVLETGYGKFGKRQLLSIAELDNQDNEFYRHVFDYYNDITSNGLDFYYGNGVEYNLCSDSRGDTSSSEFSNAQPKEIQVPTNFHSNNKAKEKDYTKHFKDILRTYDLDVSTSSTAAPNADSCGTVRNNLFILGNLLGSSYTNASSPLGSSATLSQSIGFYIGGGIGGNSMTKMTTTGVQWSWQNDRSEGMTSLIDIDGDGLDDVVIKQGASLFFKKHYVYHSVVNDEPNAFHYFGIMRPINEMSQFYLAYGRSNTRNSQSTFGIFSAGGFRGHDSGDSKSETDTYFTDGNGDGLPDIVRDGIVFFNRLDSFGNPTFNNDSRGTENLVITAAPVEIEVPDAYFEDEVTYPAFDVVKVWEAPADGEIKITNDITLTDVIKESLATVEMRKVPPVGEICYTVSFPVPEVTYYSYSCPNVGQLTVTQTNICHSRKLFKYTWNNQDYSEANLYYYNGDTNGVLNTFCPTANDLINNYTSIIPYTLSVSGDFDARHSDAFSSPLIAALSNFDYANLYIGPAVSRQFYDPVNVNFRHIGGSNINYLSLDPNAYIDTSVHFEYANATSPLFIYGTRDTFTVGLNTDISINNTPIANYPYTLHTSITPFKNWFETQYPGSTVTESAGIVTIVTPANLNTISLSGNYGTTPLFYYPEVSYNFTPTPCDQPRVPSESEIADMRDDWKSYKPSKEEFELIANKHTASDTTLACEIPDIPCIHTIDATEKTPDNNIAGLYYYSKENSKTEWRNSNGLITDRKTIQLLEPLLPANFELSYKQAQNDNKKSVAEYRKENQRKAKLWLDDYYKKHPEANPVVSPASETARNYNLTNCTSENTELCLLFGTKLTGTNSHVTNTITTGSAACNSEGSPLTVKKGDRIYFRLHSVANGNPPVNWNPRVEYTNSALSTVTDANGLPVFNKAYSDGFVLSGKITGQFPGQSGTANISWPNITVNPTDEITYRITQKQITMQPGGNGTPIVLSNNIIYDQVCLPNTNTLVQAPGIVTVTAPTGGYANLTQTFFIFEVLSTSNAMNWKDNLWKPKMDCTYTQDYSSGDTPGPPLPVDPMNPPPADPNAPPPPTDGSVTLTQTLYPIPDYSLYKLHTCGPVYNRLDVSTIGGGTGLYITPNLNGIFSPTDNGTINFVVKRGGQFLGRRVFTVNNGTVSVDNTGSIPLNNLSGLPTSSLVEISFSVDDSNRTDEGVLMNRIAMSSIVLASINGSSTLNVGRQYINLFHKVNPVMGTFYNEWGQFMYNPNNVADAPSTGAPLNVSLLKEEAFVPDQATAAGFETLATYFQNNAATMTPEDFADYVDDIQALIDGIHFLPATPSRSDIDNLLVDKWIGMHSENYAKEFSYRAAGMNQAVSSFQDNDNFINPGIVLTGAFAISKYAMGISNSRTAGGGIMGLGISLAGGTGANETLTDYSDMNGDRYPDIMANADGAVPYKVVQYTNRTGGLKSYELSGYEHLGFSYSGSNGFTASGSYSKSGDQDSDNDSTGNGDVSYQAVRSNSGAGISINFQNGYSLLQKGFADVNGDGLADSILSTPQYNNTNIVKFNNGSGSIDPYDPFPNPSTNTLPIFNSFGSTKGAGLGVNLWQGSFEAGIAVTKSWNNTLNTLIDINGDGMADIVTSYEGKLHVQLNRGNHFEPSLEWAGVYNLERESASINASINTGFTFAFILTIYFLQLKIPAININGTPLSGTTNRTYKSIRDFDGDGYPDLIEEINDQQIKVYPSKIRRTDMLKSVTNPLGGKYFVDYTAQPVTYGDPHPKWVMTEVRIEDNYDKVNDGNDIYKKRFIYEDGKYDRREREFNGYGTVKVKEYFLDDQNQIAGIYRTQVSKYHNISYFTKGLLKESYVLQGEDETKIFSKVENFYKVKRLDATNNALFNPATDVQDNYDLGGEEGRRTASAVLIKTINSYYELEPSPALITEVNFTYDYKARVSMVNSLGNISDNSDDYTTTIKYHDDAALVQQNIINVPKTIEVIANTNIIRLRNTQVDGQGRFSKIIARIDNSNDAETDMKYDNYGNLIQIMYPENLNAERLQYDYGYDTTYNKYVIDIKDSYGYNSTAEYDGKFDKILKTTDLTSNSIIYEYDSFGRTTKVLGPNDPNYTLLFEYYPKLTDLPSSSNATTINFVPVALSRHYDILHPGNDIETFTFIDGLARPIQIKKDITIDKNEDSHNPSFIEALSISGKTKFDGFGRAEAQYHPFFEEKGDATKFLLNEYDAPYFSSVSYDEIDRPLKMTDPDGNSSQMQYSLDDNGGSAPMGLKTVSMVDNSAFQIITETFRDARGKVLLTKNVGSTTLETKFSYNAIGELVEYKDAGGIITTCQYDLLGRKTAVAHPDNGLTSYTYDKAGNLTELQTANLQADGSLNPADRFIKYDYWYRKLLKESFPPISGGNNISSVTYKYGMAGNETGRLVYQQDATGWQEFAYGNMGEIKTNKRVVIGPNIPTRIFITEFTYDSWNRLMAMTYPDGEKVTFNYDLGGNLNEMVGEYNSNPYHYIKGMYYDYYEQRTFLLYGNHTETAYNYSPTMRRLETFNVKTSNAADLIIGSYDYDSVGNILKIDNAAAPVNTMGGSYSMGFQYDEFNRLVDAGGSWSGDNAQLSSGNDANSSFSLNLQYNATHGIDIKEQRHGKNGATVPANSYLNTYKYNSVHQVIQISDQNVGGLTSDYSYDLNGNIINIANNNNSVRKMYWDEVNRLRIVEDSHNMVHSIFDASGERVLKANTDIETVAENGMLTSPGTVTINSYTTYPSGYLTIDPQGKYTKHYYAGAERIVSRMGHRGLSIFDFDDKGGEDPKDRPSNPKGEKKLGEQEIRQLQISDLQRTMEKAKRGKPLFKTFKAYTDEEIAALDQEDKDDDTGKGPVTAASEPLVGAPIYYYHSDQVGTTKFLTDASGQPYQFFINLPFGETMGEQLPSSYYKTPYKFNAKELDPETGYYYYGARFYDPRASIWLSVDPLAEKYPAYSPYCYVMNNPINAIDPDGRVVIFINGQHTGDGGNSSYWNGLDNRIMNRIGDHNARYYDGAMGGFKNTISRVLYATPSFFTSLRTLNLFSSARKRAGSEMGYRHAAEIFNNLADGETIKIASHSMGGAYAKGFINGLNKYAKENGIDMKGKIEMEIDLAPFQPTSQSAQPSVPTTVVAHNGDTVAGSEPMPGANNNVTRKNKESGMSEHSVDSFSQKEINSFVPQSNNNGSGSSIWEQKPQK